MKWFIASDIHGSAYYCEKLLEAYKREGADKLLVSQIKIGDEVRQIVSGIAKYYTPAVFALTLIIGVVVPIFAGNPFSSSS